MNRELDVQREIGTDEFAAGMLAIAAAYWREITTAQIDVFYGILGRQMSTEEWKGVVTSVLSSREESPYPPTPGQLLAARDELREERKLERENEERKGRVQSQSLTFYDKNTGRETPLS